MPIVVMVAGIDVMAVLIGWRVSRGLVYWPVPGVTTAPEHKALTNLIAAFMFTPPKERIMAAIDEDDRPKKKIAHEIGQDLALLSVEELNDRIALLNDEVARLRAALEKKRASRSAADQFFKR
jgi:uncharacterized small protein (DUF1192 family)